MKKSFRVFSILLVFVMLFGAFNVSGYTEEKIVSEENPEDEVGIDYPQGVVEYAPPSVETETQIQTSTGTRATATIEEGVYAIVSASQPNRWMTIENGSRWEGARLQHKYSTTSPASDFDRASLFKISRYGTTNRYIIRCMTNNRMTIDITSSGIVTAMIPAADSEVSTSDMFFFEDTGDGYYIYSCSGRYAINLESTSNANLSYVTKSSATSSAKWNLIKYTGQNQSGMISNYPVLWKTKGGVVGEVGEFRLAAWSTYINANVVSMEIRSGYTTLADSQWDSNTNTMLLTAKNPGRILLDVKISTADGSVVFSGFYNYVIIPQEGTYYVKNAGTEKYIDIEGPSTSSGAIIHQWQYHVGRQEKWNIEHVDNSGGYVRLKSEYSNLYLGIDSANTSSVKQYGTQNDYTLWMIDRGTTGKLIFKCKATESTGAVLAVPLNANANGTDLTQISYTNNTNYRDEWILYKCNYIYYAEHYYDYGFSLRFDSITFDAEELLNICQNLVAERLNRIFGVAVSPSYTIYSSSPDECKISTYGALTFSNLKKAVHITQRI